MEDMVKELLTVSRIENNKFITQKTDIAEQLRLQIADMAELIENKNWNCKWRSQNICMQM